MAITGLDHFNIRATDLDAMRDFFVEVIGLTVGPRPDFPFAGYWLYGTDGSGAIVHLVGADRERYVAGHGEGNAEGTGVVDHLAFRGAGLQDLKTRLDARGATYRERLLPNGAATQLFIAGPEGVTIEIVVANT